MRRPLLSVYLAMAARLPVTSRDMLHQAEVWQGLQLVREVIAVAAADPTASLADKLALYEQSAVMSAADRQRLRAMIAVVQRRQLSQLSQGNQVSHAGASDLAVHVLPAEEQVLADAEADDAYGEQPPMLRYNGRRVTERLEATQ